MKTIKIPASVAKVLGLSIEIDSSGRFKEGIKDVETAMKFLKKNLKLKKVYKLGKGDKWWLLNAPQPKGKKVGIYDTKSKKLTY